MVSPGGVVCPGNAGFPNGFATFGAGPVALNPVDVQASPKLKIYFGEARTEGTREVKATREIQAERIVSCELQMRRDAAFIPAARLSGFTAKPQLVGPV